MAYTKNLKAVIHLLKELEENHNTNFRDIVYRIAQENPSVLLATVDAMHNPPEPDWIDVVRMYLRDDKFVFAVREYKNATGTGLMKAKEAVEDMPEYQEMKHRRMYS